MTQSIQHRRRMETEAKAKVVVCSIPYCDNCFASVDLEEMVEFNLFFQIDRGKIASAVWN